MKRTIRGPGLLPALALVVLALSATVLWVVSPLNRTATQPTSAATSPSKSHRSGPLAHTEWSVADPGQLDVTPEVAAPLHPYVVPPAIERLLDGAETLAEEPDRALDLQSKPDHQIIERRRLLRVKNNRKTPEVVVKERVIIEGGVIRVLHQELHAADQVIVQLKSGTPAAALEKLNDRFGARIIRRMIASDTYLVRLQERSIAAVEKAVASYHAEAATISIAEPNYILHATETAPNDTYLTSLYAMRNTGQTGGTAGADIKATMAWDITTGSANVLVGVIDTGIDYQHPDLAANIWTNPGEIAGNGLDDDGNGFIDDIHGWDFVSDDNDPMDGHYHGTHCAGTIGGVGNNGQGVAGVCWTVKMAALKFLSDSGSGSLSDAVDAVYYGTRIGCHLTSNSWGGGGFSQTLKNAIDDAGAHGVLFVAAAGNSAGNNDTTPFYPASYTSSNLIAVAATDHKDALAGFSCYGLTSVDLGAPGVSIYSCKPNNSYQSLSGTSMATPHVAGVCALVKSLAPGMGVAAWKSQILSNVDSIPSLNGKCVTGGRLNAQKAVQTLVGPYVVYESSTIDDDSTGGSTGNGDSVLNPGETVGLTVQVRSTGTQTAEDIVGTLALSSPDASISIPGDSVTYGDMTPGASSTGSGQFFVQIQPDCTTPKALTFVLTLRDAQSRAWTNSFTFQVLVSASIAGIVLKDGQPLAGATVTYSGARSGTLTTGESGQYNFLATNGSYSVRASFTSYLDTNTVALAVPPGHAGVDFPFTTATVSGTVRSVETGLGLAGATVSYTGALTGSVTTGAGGQYAITRVFGRTGQLTLTVSLAGYLTSSPVTVTVPTDATRDFTLGRPSLSISPDHFSFTVEQGQTATGTLRISNSGSLPLTYSVVPNNAGTPTGLWHQTTHRVHGEETSWYYGIENQWDYDDGSRNTGSLTFTDVNVPASNPILSFWQWRLTEHDNFYDASWVQVSTDGGLHWTTVFNCTEDDAAWIQTQVSLVAFAGQTVAIRFFFDTKDEILNQFEGWYISEVRLNSQPLEWLSATPDQGSVAIGTTQDVQITASSTGLAPGTHTASLRVSTNDPDTPLVTVPVSFTIVPMYTDVFVNASNPIGDDTDGDPQFRTIMAAFDSVMSGGRVHVAEGTYTEDVVIPDALTIFAGAAAGGIQSIAIADDVEAVVVQPGTQANVGRLHIWDRADFSGGIDPVLGIRVRSLPATPLPGIHHDDLFSSTGDVVLGGTSLLRLDLSGLSNQCGTIFPVEVSTLAFDTEFSTVELTNNTGAYSANVSYDHANGDVQVDLMCAPKTLQVADIASARPLFAWDAVTGIDGYQIRIVEKVSQTVVFSGPVSRPFTCPFDLNATIAYEWAVRTLRGPLVSAWKSGSEFTVPLPTVSVTATAPLASESGPSAGMLTFDRFGCRNSPLTVNFGVTGTATGGVDYTPLDASIVIPAGVARVSIAVTPLEDAIAELDETVIAIVTGGAGYTVGAPHAAAVTIKDNETPQVVVVATDPTAAEPGTDTGTFTFVRLGNKAAALTVRFAMSGTARRTFDYYSLGSSVIIPAGASTATKTLVPRNDRSAEPDETATLTITIGTGYVPVAPASATITIADDETPTISVTASDALAYVAGLDPGAFTLKRLGNKNVPVMVSVFVTGTAIAGTDYAPLGTTIVIPSGVQTLTLPVIPHADAVSGLSRSVKLVILAGTGYLVARPTTASVMIISSQ